MPKKRGTHGTSPNTLVYVQNPLNGEITRMKRGEAENSLYTILSREEARKILKGE